MEKALVLSKDASVMLRLPLISTLNVLSSDTSGATQTNCRSYCGEMRRPLDMTMC